MKEFNCEKNQIKKLDFTKNMNIESIGLNDNPKLSEITFLHFEDEKFPTLYSRLKYIFIDNTSITVDFKDELEQKLHD